MRTNWTSVSISIVFYTNIDGMSNQITQDQPLVYRLLCWLLVCASFFVKFVSFGCQFFFLFLLFCSPLAEKLNHTYTLMHTNLCKIHKLYLETFMVLNSYRQCLIFLFINLAPFNLVGWISSLIGWAGLGHPALFIPNIDSIVWWFLFHTSDLLIHQNITFNLVVSLLPAMHIARVASNQKDKAKALWNPSIFIIKLASTKFIQNTQ